MISDAERALKFAFLITQRLGKNIPDYKEELCRLNVEKFNFVARVSSGVSTGPTFCVSISPLSTEKLDDASFAVFQGVLGHPLRCEYTVIGRKVNMVRAGSPALVAEHERSV